MNVMDFNLTQLIREVPSFDSSISNCKRARNLEIERNWHPIGVVFLILPIECRLGCLVIHTMSESRFMTLRILAFISLGLQIGQVVVLIRVVLNFVTFLAPHVVQEEFHLCFELYLLLLLRFATAATGLL